MPTSSPYNNNKCGKLNRSWCLTIPERCTPRKRARKCKPGFYKIMMFIAKCKKSDYLCQGDFHFYKQHSKTEYKVKRGDTHESIAQFFKVPVLRIKRAAKVLKPGKIITFKADFFSHKRGWATGPLMVGAKGKLITDPRKIFQGLPWYELRQVLQFILRQEQGGQGRSHSSQSQKEGCQGQLNFERQKIHQHI
jgi:LysM repeat protein